MQAPAPLSEGDFARFRDWLQAEAGIQMSPAKKALISGRLAKRLKAHRLSSFGEYFRYLKGDPGELQLALDLLTTNETYFFREEKHFRFLEERICAQPPRGRELRVWSAACSSGEEPYSVAMTLADRLGYDGWGIVASDLSLQVLEKARRGLYPLERAERIPRDYLRRYCLKGTGAQQGRFLVQRQLRERLRFAQINLSRELPRLGQFDLILLRNVMIYFGAETKRAVLSRVVSRLRPGGYLFIGHSESLAGLGVALDSVAPAIHRRPL